MISHDMRVLVVLRRLWRTNADECEGRLVQITCNQVVDRPVTVVATAHCRSQKPMGNHRRSGVCTSDDAGASRDCSKLAIFLRVSTY